MRRRLDLAGALVAEVPVLFLDEPTTGLDPRSRTEVWDMITELVKGGTTVLLTTQYLEEADQLADNILVIDHGQAIAEGTADELKAQVGGERIEIVVASATDLSAARRCWPRSSARGRRREQVAPADRAGVRRSQPADGGTAPLRCRAASSCPTWRCDGQRWTTSSCR